MNKLITYTASVSVVALFSISGAVAAPIQWSAADGGNDHWYEINTDVLSWTDAETAAQARGGYLATVTSAGENGFIDDVTGRNNGLLWLGGSDAASEGDWFWMTGPEAGTQFWEGGKDGNPVGGAYTNWASLEPNNGIVFGEDYLAEWSTHDFLLPDGEWDDASGRYASLIEYDTLPGASDPAQVPEPSSAALALIGLAGLAMRKRKKAA